MNSFLPYVYRKNKIEVEIDWSNYATKSDIKTEKVLIHQNSLNMMI